MCVCVCPGGCAETVAVALLGKHTRGSSCTRQRRVRACASIGPAQCGRKNRGANHHQPAVLCGQRGKWEDPGRCWAEMVWLPRHVHAERPGCGTSEALQGNPSLCPSNSPASQLHVARPCLLDDERRCDAAAPAAPRGALLPRRPCCTGERRHVHDAVPGQRAPTIAEAINPPSSSSSSCAAGRRCVMQGRVAAAMLLRGCRWRG